MVNRTEPFKKDGAIILFVRGVCAVGVRSQIDHVLVDLRGLVVATEDVKQQSFVVACFERIGILFDGFLYGRERFFVLALAPKDLADVNEGACVLRVGLCHLAIFFRASSS